MNDWTTCRVVRDRAGAAAAVVEVRARTAPALTALAQRLRDAAHEAERCNCCDDDTARACPVHNREDNHE